MHTGVQVPLYSFLTAAGDICPWSVSCPGRFAEEEMDPTSHATLSEHYSRSHFGKGKNLSSLSGFKIRYLGRPVCSVVTISTELRRPILPRTKEFPDKHVVNQQMHTSKICFNLLVHCKSHVIAKFPNQLFTYITYNIFPYRFISINSKLSILKKK
jgi:hypothetical protein